MDIKNSFTGIKNCREVNTNLIHDSLSINKEDEAIVYAKSAENDDCDDCVFVSGNIGAMIYLIAEMIILISKNSGVSISPILATISSIIIGLRGSLR